MFLNHIIKIIDIAVFRNNPYRRRFPHGRDMTMGSAVRQPEIGDAAFYRQHNERGDQVTRAFAPSLVSTRHNASYNASRNLGRRVSRL